MPIWLIVLIVYIVLFVTVMLFMCGASSEEMPRPDGLEPCSLDGECGDNEGGGCGRYPFCLEDYEV